MVRLGLGLYLVSALSRSRGSHREGQGGEGRLEKGKHVNRSADFAKGYICKQFKLQDDDENADSDDDSSSSGSGFSPREESVIMLAVIHR